MSQVARKYGALTIYRRLILQARPYWPHIAGFLLLSLLATPLALLSPLPLKVAVDSILSNHPPPALLDRLLPQGWTQPSIGALVVAAMVVLLAVLTQVRSAAVSLLRTYVGEKLVLSFRGRLFQHVQRLSLSYHDSKGTGDSAYRIQYDAPSIQAVVIDSLVPLIGAVFMLASMIYVTARLSGRLALTALLIAPLLGGAIAFFSNRMRKQWHEVKDLESSANSVVQEVLGAMRVVKAFTREKQEQERFAAHSNRGHGARMRAALQERYFTTAVGMIVACGTAAVLYIGIGDVRRGALTLGELLLVMAYLKQLYEPLKTIGKQLASKQRSLAGAERAFELLDELPEVIERPHARPLARAGGQITFNGLCFRYGDEGPMVLRDVSIDIPAGRRVGIAGRTGAGKTTLMNLLTRFYDPVQGQILLDGVDLRDYRLADLRNQFSIVLQDPVLFSTTIAENIAYGRTGAAEAEVIAAARAADAHEFIAALPDGYETPVGERGMRLSGGERQRIALARAFLKDAPLLILDEPTSSVDTETEAAIMRAMERLMHGRTTFMIAHRLGTLQNCESLLWIDQGMVRLTTPAEVAACGGPLVGAGLSVVNENGGGAIEGGGEGGEGERRELTPV